jgi:hypothetical protein
MMDLKADAFEAAKSIAADLGLPDKFVDQLNKSDDDWSFVIKSHALMESVLTLLLTEVFGKPQVRDTLAEIDTSQKLRMCSDLSLFEKSERTFMRELSKLRNVLVHNVDQVEFSFSEHLKNKDVANNFVTNFGTLWKDPVTIGSKTISRKDITLENPRLTVWLLLIEVLGEVYLYRKRIEFERHKSAETEKLLERHTAFVKRLSELTTVAGEPEWIHPAVTALKQMDVGEIPQPLESAAGVAGVEKQQ